MSHTPGPWEFVGNGCIRSPFEIGNPERAGVEIATVAPWQPEHEANARLIAAAPDLLLALKEIVAFNTPLPCGLLPQARKAIAKAEGKEVAE
jgi:hypothetical protein